VKILLYFIYLLTQQTAFILAASRHGLYMCSMCISIAIAMPLLGLQNENIIETEH
jgi:hypothetical protein